MSTPHRRPIEILETDIEEKFVKGSGPGGQKSINSAPMILIIEFLF
jgi:protein subunit release factor B